MACCGSVGPVRDMICFCVRNVVAPMRRIRTTAKILTFVPLAWTKSRRLDDEVNDVDSETPSSLALAICSTWSAESPTRGAHSSTPFGRRTGWRWLKTWNSAMNSGICSTIGRHPSSGLPCSLCNAMISAFIFCLSCPCFSRISLILGCIICIVRWDFTCLTNSGKIRIRTQITNRTTENAHAKKLSYPKMGPKPLWKKTIAFAARW